jgi:hypothetical protein
VHLNENFRLGPPAITVNDAELSGVVRVRLKEQRFEDAFVPLDLPLEFRIFLRMRGCRSFGRTS